MEGARVARRLLRGRWSERLGTTPGHSPCGDPLWVDCRALWRTMLPLLRCLRDRPTTRPPSATPTTSRTPTPASPNSGRRAKRIPTDGRRGKKRALLRSTPSRASAVPGTGPRSATTPGPSRWTSPRSFSRSRHKPLRLFLQGGRGAPSSAVPQSRITWTPRVRGIARRERESRGCSRLPAPPPGQRPGEQRSPVQSGPDNIATPQRSSSRAARRGPAPAAW